MAPKKVIAGWSRGGLGYIHALLSHMKQNVGFNFSSVVTLEDFNNALPKSCDIEISSGFAPFLDHEALADSELFFVVRDPMRVFNSMYFLGLMHAEKASYPLRLTKQHLPTASKFLGKPGQLAVHYLEGTYLEAGRKAKKQIKVLRVEDGPMRLLYDLGLKGKFFPFIPTDVNASYCRQVFVPSKLPPQASNIMQRMLRFFGYRQQAWFPRGGHAHYVNPDWHY